MHFPPPACTPHATPGPWPAPDACRALSIAVLGTLSVTARGALATPTQAGPRQLLALLATSTGAVVRHETISQELWNAPPSPPLIRAIQSHVWRLRKQLDGPPGADGSPIIELLPQVGYRLAPETTVDARTLDGVARRAKASQASGHLAQAADLLQGVLSLTDRPALADVSRGPALAARELEIAALQSAVLQTYLELQLALARPAMVVAEAARIMRRPVSNEGLYTALVVALAELGRSTEAMDVFHRVRTQTAAQFGLRPSRSLIAAAERAMAT